MDALTKRGYAYKRGRRIKNWKKRYFVLSDGALVYYEDEDGLVPLGQMPLFGAAVVYVEPPKVDRHNCVEVSTPSRSLFLSADTQKELKEWALAIQRVSIVASGGKITLSSHRIKMTADGDEQVDDAQQQAKEEPKANGHDAGAGASVAGAAAAGAAAGGAAAAAAAAPAQAKSSEPASKADSAAPAAAAAPAQPDESPAVNPASPSASASAAEPSRSLDAFAKEEQERAALREKVEFTEEELAANRRFLAEAFQREDEAWEARKQAVKVAKKEMGKWELMQDVRVRKQLKGHIGMVTVVACGYERIVSGGSDATVRAWNLSSLKKKGVYEDHDDVVKAVAVHNKFVASSADDGTVKLWTTKKGKCKVTLNTSTNLAADALTLTSDGSVLICASDRTIQVWDISSMKDGATPCVANVQSGHEGRIVSMALAGRFLFTGSEDHTIRMWDMTTLGHVTTLEGHRNWVFCMALAPSRDELITGSEHLKVWDISKMAKGKVKCTTTKESPHDCPSVQCMAVSEDDRYLVTGSMDGFVRVWELKLKKKSEPEVSLENRTKFIFSIAFAMSGNIRRIMTADRDGSVKVWE